MNVLNTLMYWLGSSIWYSVVWLVAVAAASCAVACFVYAVMAWLRIFGALS